MMHTLFMMPLGFWAALALGVWGVIAAIGRISDGTGVPTLAVLATVGTWYVGDAFYNDYAEFYTAEFDAAIRRSAWWQVAWFVAAFLILAPVVHRWINARYLKQSSRAFFMFNHGVNQPSFQKELNQLFTGAFIIWTIIAVLAAIRLQGLILYYFFPFLGYNVYPWGRQRVGTGFDAVFTIIFYVQELASATFGVVAAASVSGRTRMLAVGLCLLAWPAFILDRTRSNMLVVIMPGILTWGLLVIRGGLVKKGLVLGVCFLMVNAWLGFVISNRSSLAIVDALHEKGFSLSGQEKVHHEGLNMYEELCWVNLLISKGDYHPNWGARYFAEAVNIVPRAFWAGKPLIGIDYARARGQGIDDGQAGVGGTVSTGVIGQGVVNFGGLLGPVAAAFLMSLWVAILARVDLDPKRVGGIPLLGLGLILTFNLGRDISFIVLYPFVFSVMLFWLLDRTRVKPAAKNPSGPSRGRQPAPLGMGINARPGTFSTPPGHKSRF